MYYKKNKVAIIGCGYWGTNIIKTLISLKVQNIYCYDNKISNLNKIKKRFKKVKLCKNLNDLLLNKEIKIVFISVPTKLIFNIAKKCLENKKNVFLEKPISKFYKKIQELINIAKRKKLKIMAGYIYLYNDYIKYIKKLITQKKLGEIKYIELNRKNYGPIRNDVSSLWDLASHDLSIIKYFFPNSKIRNRKHLKTSITKKNIQDIYSVHFNIKKTIININVSWLYPEKVRQILIIGTKKILMFDEMDTDKPIKIYDVIKSYPSAADIPLFYFNPQTKFIIKKPLFPKFKKIYPLAEELKYCLKNFNTNKKILTDGNFALEITRELSKF